MRVSARAPAHVRAPHPPPGGFLRLSPRVGALVGKLSVGVRVLLAAVLRRGLWLLRTAPRCAHTRFAGYMKGIHPKAFNWAELELLFASPRAGFPPLKISLSPLSLSPRRVDPTMCHCSGPGETWTRVGGRYFSLSGSVVSDCAGPLSGFFGVV